MDSHKNLRRCIQRDGQACLGIAPPSKSVFVIDVACDVELKDVSIVSEEGHLVTGHNVRNRIAASRQAHRIDGVEVVGAQTYTIPIGTCVQMSSGRVQCQSDLILSCAAQSILMEHAACGFLQLVHMSVAACVGCLRTSYYGGNAVAAP